MLKPALAISLLAAVLALAPAAAAGSTTATVQRDTSALLGGVAADWARMQTDDGVFPNPFPAEAVRNPPFSPPMLTYALLRMGERTGNSVMTAAALRAIPLSVSPRNASTFDLVAAAYAYRAPGLPADTRAYLADYMSRYGIPHNGYGCFVKPGCFHNLVLVDALAVLAITNNGISSPREGERMHDPAEARQKAVEIVNEKIPRLVDHALRANGRFGALRGTVLSDPNRNQLAYHALCSFMLGQAVKELGSEASPAVVRVLHETLDALSVLIAPDGDVSYMGRGQSQVWVPGLTAGAMIEGARLVSATDPVRAARYLAVAERAVARLGELHLTPSAFRVVPGARVTTDGIDGYANTIAYNGLAMFGLAVALDTADQLPPLRVGALPAHGRLTVSDPHLSGMGIVANGRTWMAVHRKSPNPRDMRYDFGLLGLKARTATGWRSMLMPRPLLKPVSHPRSAGPNLLVGREALRPIGRRLRASGDTVTVKGGWRRGDRWVRTATFTWSLRPGGARMTVRGLRAGERVSLLAFTPAGTGRRIGRRGLRAAGTRWSVSVPIAVRRVRGYHSGPVENLDALEIRARAGARPLTIDLLQP